MEQEICICEYCGRPVKNLPLSKTGHYRVCKKYREFKENVKESLTKDFLYEKYIIEELSMSAIAGSLGLKKHSLVFEKLKEYNIPIRTHTETRRTKGYIESTKRTCHKKYNADYHTCANSSKRNEIDDGIRKYMSDAERLEIAQSKAKETLQKNFGVDYISQSKYWSDSVRQTCLKKYGVDNPWKSEMFIRKGLETKYKNLKDKVYTYSSRKANSLFDELRNALNDSEHIYCASKGKEFGLRIKETGRYCFYDFVDTEHKKCIEFNGNYFHANPLMYAPDFFVKKRQMRSREIWQADFEKLERLEKEGYDIKIVWESEFDADPIKTINECVEFMKL